MRVVGWPSAAVARVMASGNGTPYNAIATFTSTVTGTIEHLLEREVGFDVRTAVGARDIVEVIDERGGMSGFTFLDEKAGFSVTDDLLRGTTPEGNDGCAGGHGLDGGQAKGLVPFDGEKQAKRLTHDFPQSQPFQLSKIGHAPSGSPQFRYDALLKIVTVVDAASD